MNLPIPTFSIAEKDEVWGLLSNMAAQYWDMTSQDHAWYVHCTVCVSVYISFCVKQKNWNIPIMLSIYKIWQVDGLLMADGIALLTTALQHLWNNTKTKNTMFQSRRCNYYNNNITKGIMCDSNPLQPFDRGDMLLEQLKQVIVLSESRPFWLWTVIIISAEA